MLRAWLQSRRRRSERQAASDLQEWLGCLQRILDRCSTSVAQPQVADVGVTLDAVDRELLRFHRFASDVQGPLRREQPELAGQVRRTTDLAYRLRNQTRTYLLRSATLHQRRRRGHPDSPEVLHKVEQAQQLATETVRALRSEIELLSPGLRRRIASWGG
ncbi:MAG: hypothetical protein AB1449_07270 [Chloroflexota bacterium]